MNPQLPTTEQTLTILTLLAIAWTLPWKGVALWKSAKNGQKGWFVVLLIVNTLAILEILYIFCFQKKPRRLKIGKKIKVEMEK